MANIWPVRKDVVEKAYAFDSVVSMPGLLVIITNLDFELLYANDYFFKFFECAPEDLLNKALYGFLSDDIRPEMNKAHIEKVIKEGAVWNYDATTVASDGEPVNIKWNQELLNYDKKNPVILSVGIVREKTKAKAERPVDNAETPRSVSMNVSSRTVTYAAARKPVHLSKSRLDVTEEEIAHALENNLFKLYYQPLVQARVKKIVGAEALLRMEHPTRGIVMPDAILPVAEKSGQIIELGKFVAGEACKKIKAWSVAGLDLTLSVNFSRRQFLDGEFAEMLLRAVTLHDVAAGRLLLEVTEDTLSHDPDNARDIIKTLRGLGCKICLDDFGTGFSSLKTLETLEIDNIKIDRSFLPSEENNRRSYTLVESLIMMAHGFNFTVTASGIETEDQAEKLMDMACDYYQGYLFSRPVPEKDFDSLLLDTPGFYLRNVE